MNHGKRNMTPFFFAFFKNYVKLIDFLKDNAAYSTYILKSLFKMFSLFVKKMQICGQAIP